MLCLSLIYALLNDHREKPDEKKIKYKARYGTKILKLKSSNYSSVKKKQIWILLKKGITFDKIRIFFSGKEMKNNM